MFIGAGRAKLRYDRRMSSSGNSPGASPTSAATSAATSVVTWDEARSFLRGKFALAKDTEEMVALGWRIPLQGNEVLQWVRVSPISVYGEPWLTILADICPQAKLSPSDACQYLSQLPFGGLIIINDHYLFRHSLSLGWLALPQLEHTIRLVAHEALRLRLAITPTTAEQQVLGHYDE